MAKRCITTYGHKSCFRTNTCNNYHIGSSSQHQNQEQQPLQPPPMKAASTLPPQLCNRQSEHPIVSKFHCYCKFTPPQHSLFPKHDWILCTNSNCVCKTQNAEPLHHSKLLLLKSDHLSYDRAHIIIVINNRMNHNVQFQDCLALCSKMNDIGTNNSSSNGEARITEPI